MTSTYSECKLSLLQKYKWNSEFVVASPQITTTTKKPSTTSHRMTTPAETIPIRINHQGYTDPIKERLPFG